MSIRFSALLSFVLIYTFSFAGEGMWLPFLLKSMNEAEMKSMGMKMNAEDIYSVNQGSLKDAIVHFGGFCTAEVISDKGLILTNHHCGYDAIQSHSTLESNYLKEGYWAERMSDEKPNQGLYATFIVRIEDVTSKVTSGVDAGMTAKERQSMIDVNIARLLASIPKEAYQEASIKPFFEGNDFYMFVTETYRDVRLVGAPPESIGKFGADTDNWVWPRHTGDFSLFRIYAGPDNKPAEYSPDNKPLKPRHFLPISLDGIDEGDFTLVFGFPGKTNQYLPAVAVDQIARVIDPARIGVRDISLGIMDRRMRENEDNRLALAVKYASLANSWKKWIGEAQGLISTGAVENIQAEEKKFMMDLQKNKTNNATYGEILPKLNQLYKEIEPYAYNRTIIAEAIGGSNIEVFKLTQYAERLIRSFKESGNQGYTQMSSRVLAQLDDFYDGYRPEVDREVFVALTAHLKEKLSNEFYPSILATVGPNLLKNIYDESIWASKEKLIEHINQGGGALTSFLEQDAAFQIYMELKNVMDQKLSPSYNVINDQIQFLLTQYMTALKTTYPDQRFWPDANNTMRVTYGQVEEYEPRDGVEYKTQTYLDGVMEKYVPGDYEFDVHPKLIQLYNEKDYGPYAENGKLPVCFIASNHTTGGNSGSPAIDAYGNLIGINFDRVWEGTMSDLYYDRSICRNIMVDIRYVLFVVDKFAGASHLVEEMKLVHPKA